MIELRTFGALDVRDDRGRELRAILAQPKRLALLTYLGSATPGPFHRRDILLSLFWPDQPAARARAALSRAVHYLRCALGEGVLLSRGDGEIGLATDRFSSDVGRFREHRASGRLADALELYRGDFLDGFFVSDVPELERWIDTERQRLRDSATDVSRALSTQSEARGDLSLALHWARHASRLAPYDEADVRRVLTLFARSGERGMAAEYYDRFARRLRDDLGLEPSSQTRSVLVAASHVSMTSSSGGEAPSQRRGTPLRITMTELPLPRNSRRRAAVFFSALIAFVLGASLLLVFAFD